MIKSDILEIKQMSRTRNASSTRMTFSAVVKLLCLCFQLFCLSVLSSCGDRTGSQGAPWFIPFQELFFFFPPTVWVGSKG